MLIPRRTVRTSQPQQAVGINRQSSLAVGLGGLFDVTNARELVYGNPAANVSSQRVISKAGRAADFWATSNQQYSHRPGYAPLGDFTIFTLFELDTLTNYTHIISKQETTTSNAPYELRIGSGPTDNNINLVRANAGSYAPRGGSAGAISPSSLPQTLAVTGGLVESRETLAYVNGKVATTLSTGPDGATGQATDSGANVWIGRRYDGATQLDGKIYYVAVWNRQLSAAEVAALHANPWQIFEDEEDYLFIPAGGGLTLNASAAGSDTASGMASLAAQVALAAVGISVAGGSASPSVSIPLSAAGLAVAGGSAGAVATVTLAAAGLAQAAGQAGLSASVFLQAAGAAQTAGNAALAAQLNALAAGAAQATGTANLTGGAPGALSASGSNVVSGVAELSITVNLQATGAAQADGSAAGVALAPGAMSGSGAAAASGWATWSCLVSLNAAGFVNAMATGSFVVDVDISAAGSGVTSGYAGLQLQGEQNSQPLRVEAYARPKNTINYSVRPLIHISHGARRA